MESLEIAEIFDPNWRTQLAIGLKVVIATVLGGTIGAEREASRKPAGLRTHAMLAAATALLVSLTPTLMGLGVDAYPDAVQADPIRIVEAIVTGIAFIGAGTIFRHREARIVEGLTTATSLLFTAAVAVTVALNQQVLAVILTVLSLVLLRVLWRLEPRSTGGTHDDGS